MSMSALFDPASPIPYDPTPLAQAIRAIASVCDGAHENDGQGFDGQDAKFGRRLAVIPEDVWSSDMIADAYHMARKYRKQLDGFGINVDHLPVPPVLEVTRVDTDFGTARKSREEARKLSRLAATTITLTGDLIVLNGPYDAERVNACRAVPGRRWTGKVDTFPLSSARPVVDLADRFGIAIPDELRMMAGDPTLVTPTPLRQVTISGPYLHLRFEYNPVLIPLVRKLPDAQWIPNPGVWQTTICDETLEFCRTHDFVLDEDVARAAAAAAAETAAIVEMSKAVDGDIDIPGLTPGSLRPFQRAGVLYALRQRRTWIADEMGLGKTRQALAAVEAADAYPCLVLCPASVKENWLIEAGMVLPGRFGETVYGKRPRSFTSQGRFDRTDIYVLNYDLVPAHLEALKRAGFRSLVCDESHEHLSNPRLGRTKAAVELGRQIALDDPDRNLVLLLTGTPVRNFADGLVPQLDVMSRLEDFGGKDRLVRRYIKEATTYGFDAERMVELHNRLRATCYIRREKAEVLTELPPKQRVTIPVVLDDTELAEYHKAEQDLIAYIRDRAWHAALEAGENPDRAAMVAALRAQAAQHLVAITTLKQLAAKARMAHARRWVDEFLESTGRKLLVFAWHSNVVDEFASAHGGLRISGKDPVPVRQRAVERFQADDTAKVIALQLKAGGVGLTLTAASDVLFLEQGWTPATHNQAEDRTHRIGQDHHVTAHYHLALGTIDERIFRLVDAKRRLNAAIEDGRIPEDYVPEDGDGAESILGDLLVDLAFGDDPEPAACQHLHRDDKYPAFCLDCAERGDYRTAHIEVDGDWVEVLPNT